MQKTVNKKTQIVAEPPAWHMLPLLHTSDEVKFWLDHYWNKLGLPDGERSRLAITQNRREFARWTGRRLNPLALGCYCYLPGSKSDPPPSTMAHVATETTMDLTNGKQLLFPGFDLMLPPKLIKSNVNSRHRHLIFVEPDLLELGTEVTVAHELIHLADRYQGQPRRHRCHGYDSIAADEAAITGYDPERLRQLLRDESARREATLRASRPFKYLYVCPHCNKEYPRVRRYPRPVSCGACDRTYNPQYLLVLRSSELISSSTVSCDTEELLD
jgi:hypothetical protein